MKEASSARPVAFSSTKRSTQNGTDLELFLRPFLVQSGLRGLLGACGGCPGGLFWPVSQAALEAHFRAPKGPENAQKQPKTAQNRASEAFQVPSGDPEIRTRAIFTEWKNAVSLHLAAIFEEKSAWDTVKYWVSLLRKRANPVFYVSK